jgi:hypothetical protein
MKKIILIIISALLLNLVLIGVSHAVSCTKKTEEIWCELDEGETCIAGICAKSALDILTPRPGGETEIPGVGETPEELKAIKKLPSIGIETAFKTAIKTILSAAMLLTIIAIVVTGIYYITSRGKEEEITKAKSIIVYLIIGLLIMAAAYGIVAGVAQFKFFKAAP